MENSSSNWPNLAGARQEERKQRLERHYVVALICVSRLLPPENIQLSQAQGGLRPFRHGLAIKEIHHSLLDWRRRAVLKQNCRSHHVAALAKGD